MTDRQIIEEIERQFSRNENLHPDDFTIEVDNGNVVLAGAVSYLSQKRDAISTAMGITGVKDVEDQITVVAPALESDPIETRVINALTRQLDFDISELDVTDTAGQLILEGSVGAYRQKLQIEEVAAAVDGVVEIINNITVVPSESESDETIAAHIMHALERRDTIDAGDIEVKVENGEVFLTGRVPTWISKNSAYETVQHVPGIIDIIDNLTIDERM
jgi:osmotically-inducible protein OsmY